MIANVIVGVMEMIYIRVDSRFVRDALKGDDVAEASQVIEYTQAQYKEYGPRNTTINNFVN